MDFSNVKDWSIANNTIRLIKVTDSQDNVIWQKKESDLPLYIENISDNDCTVTFKKYHQNNPDFDVYVNLSIGNNSWFKLGAISMDGISRTISPHRRLYIRATTNGWGNNTANNSNYILCSEFCNVGGNIASLIYGSNFNGNISFDKSYKLSGIFYNNNKLISAENLYLPTVNNEDSNNYMLLFQNCTSLTTPPILSANSISNYGYRYMFQGCTSLTQAPALPATTLGNYCYQNMFDGCTSLTTAPELPATTLKTSCYNSMFKGCTSLNSVTTYATDISASGCITNWLDGVSATGDFYNLGGATYPTGASGIPEGWTKHTSL